MTITSIYKAKNEKHPLFIFLLLYYCIFGYYMRLQGRRFHIKSWNKKKNGSLKKNVKIVGKISSQKII